MALSVRRIARLCCTLFCCKRFSCKEIPPLWFLPLRNASVFTQKRPPPWGGGRFMQSNGTGRSRFRPRAQGPHSRPSMKTSLRRYYPDQVQGLKPMASSQPAQSPAPLVRFWQVVFQAEGPPGRRTLRQRYLAYSFRQLLSSGGRHVSGKFPKKCTWALDKSRRLFYNL